MALYRIIMDAINEVDSLEKEVMGLEEQAKLLDEISIALEKKVDSVKNNANKAKK